MNSFLLLPYVGGGRGPVKPLAPSHALFMFSCGRKLVHLVKTHYAFPVPVRVRAQKHSCVVQDFTLRRFRNLILLKCFCEQPATRSGTDWALWRGAGLMSLRFFHLAACEAPASHDSWHLVNQRHRDANSSADTLVSCVSIGNITMRQRENFVFQMDELM